MSQLRGKRSKCAVASCNSEHKSIHLLPASEPLKTQWLRFIFKGNVPKNAGKYLYVCANHFTSDCFVNEGQYNAGFASKLLIKDGSIPTLRYPTTSHPPYKPTTREVGCQCNAPILKSVAVQAVLTQKKPKRRSKAIQVRPLVSHCDSVSCSDEDFSVKSEFTLTPIKRPRMEDSPEGSPYSSEEPTDDNHVPNRIKDDDIKLEPCESSYIVVTI